MRRGSGLMSGRLSDSSEIRIAQQQARRHPAAKSLD